MNRRPIAAAMIVVGVLASGCVSRRTYLAKSDEAGALAIALANEEQKAATLSARAGDLEQQLAESRKSLEGTTGERDRLVAELEQRRSEQARQVDDLSRRLADTESRIAALTAERDRLVGDTQAREARAQELAAQLEAARRDLAAAQQTLSGAQGELATARQALEDTRGQLATAQRDFAGAVEERDRLAAERRDLETRTRDLTAEVSSAGQQLGETRGQLEATRQQLEQARGELTTAQQDLARATGERDQAAAERERLEAEARDLSAQLSTTRDQLGVASGERDAARQEADATRRQLETARGELTATEQALAQARGEVTSAQQALSGTQGELTSVQQSLGVTKEEMAARERKLEEAIAAYDKLVSDLRQEISEGQVQISRLRDKLTVRVLDRVLFDSGSARIKPTGQEVLRKVADTARTLTDQEVHIEGHTDNVPIKETYRHVFPTNWELSTARATGVARFLQEKATVDPGSLAAVGYGEHRPAQPNDTPDGRAQNRRIEIVLVPRDAETAAR